MERGLDLALALAADCHLAAPPHIRRQLNQAVFEQIFVENGEVPTGRLETAFGELLELVEADRDSGAGLRGPYLRTAPVEPTSIREIEATIARILAGNEETKQHEPWPLIAGPGFERRPIGGEGGFDPRRRRTPETDFESRRSAPGSVKSSS